MDGFFPRGFGKLAVFAIVVNGALFIGAVAVIAYAVKWVIS